MVFSKVIGRGLILNPWLGVGYTPGGLNTSDGLAKSMSSVNLGSLLAVNTFQIATEQMGDQIRKSYIPKNITSCIQIRRKGGKC